MRFNTLIVLTSTLATAICAGPDTKAAQAEMTSYANAQSTNTAWSSIDAFFATKTEASKTFAAFQTSIAGVLSSGKTLKSNYLEALPTEIRPFYSSYMAGQISIASKHGFPVAIEGVPTSVAKGAAPTAKPVAAGAVLVAGLLGIAAL